jgi:hypothetical protein
MAEDVVDCGQQFVGDGSIISSTFHDSEVELVESGVVACCVLGGFDEDPADVAVAFVRERESQWSH